MSTIIECPACATRYKMNKAIPEGGRSVKCARCGNQWRLVPEGFVEETIEPDAAEHNPVGAAPAEGVDWQPPRESASETSRAFSQGGEEDAADEAGGRDAWQAARDPFSAAISTPSRQALGDDQSSAAIASGGEEIWRGLRERTDQAAAFAESSEAGEKSAHGGRFDAAAPQQEDHEADGEATAEEARLSWARQISRPWREIATPPPPPESEQEEEDTEAAIREALRAALEQPGDENRLMSHFEETAEPRLDPGVSSGFGWDPFTPRNPAGGLGDDQPGAIEAEQGAFRIPGHDSDADEEPPFRLTGKSARLPIYGSGNVDHDEPDQDKDAASGDLAFQNDIEDAFRTGPLPKKTIEQARGKVRHEEPLTDFDSIYDQMSARLPGGNHAVAVDYGAETAALQAELESTDVTAYEDTRNVGGLAVAAAWAVFLSVISGLALGLVSFRQEIMVALPGTTSLYRSVGFNVAGAGVDFADVSYRWTVAEGKPMIEVTGQVVNVTDRTVTVPRVLINVRDAKSADAVKVTASVPTDTLAPRESASFTLEFLSPPKNITQIELEFDRNR